MEKIRKAVLGGAMDLLATWYSSYPRMLWQLKLRGPHLNNVLLQSRVNCLPKFASSLQKMGAVTRPECQVVGFFKAQAGRAVSNSSHLLALCYMYFSTFHEICRELADLLLADSWWLCDDFTDSLWAADSHVHSCGWCTHEALQNSGSLTSHVVEDDGSLGLGSTTTLEVRSWDSCYKETSCECYSGRTETHKPTIRVARSVFEIEQQAKG